MNTTVKYKFYSIIYLVMGVVAACGVVKSLTFARNLVNISFSFSHKNISELRIKTFQNGKC